MAMRGPAKLSTWRERVGLTQTTAGDRVGLSQFTISELERGAIRRVSVETARAIEVLTEGEVSWLDWVDESSSSPAPLSVDDS